MKKIDIKQIIDMRTQRIMFIVEVTTKKIVKKEFRKLKKDIIKQIGYLIFKDKEKISLVGTLLHQHNSETYTSDDYYREILIIPISNIIKITKLRRQRK